MTALALAGIAIFAVALVVVAIGTVRQAVRYVRDVRDVVRAGTDMNLRDRPLENAFSLPSEARPEAEPPPAEPDSNVPPGWGFR